MNLVDRLFRTAWRFVFVLVLLVVAAPMLVALITLAVHWVGEMLGFAFQGIGGLFCLLLVFLFAVGIVVRGARAVRRAATEIADDQRRTRGRAASRRRAENVPGFGAKERLPHDPDPNLEV
jgi:hypothetical protein